MNWRDRFFIGIILSRFKMIGEKCGNDLFLSAMIHDLLKIRDIGGYN